MSIILRKMQKSRNRAAEIRGEGKTEKPCRGKALFYLSLLNDELLGVHCTESFGIAGKQFSNNE